MKIEAIDGDHLRMTRLATFLVSIMAKIIRVHVYKTSLLIRRYAIVLVRKTKEEEVIKHPLKRFESTLRKSIQIAIPTNLDRLRRHRNNIEKVTICITQ